MRNFRLRIAITLVHAFNVLSLCEADSYLELVANFTALPETFNTTTAVSLLECCMKCDQSSNCVTVGYNANSRECVLFGTTNVAQRTVQTIDPTGFQVFRTGLLTV